MVDQKMVLTRSQARMLIKQGNVLCNGEPVKKPGQLVTEKDRVVIEEVRLYVSRGAYKLEKAIEYYNLDFNNKIIMDCGASTGGFTQVSLEHGAKKVYALDVGHDQLAQMLVDHDRVINIEGLNLKHDFSIEEKADVFVMDISFISIKLVIDNIIKNLNSNGEGVLLIKPQFEVGKEKIKKNGIVKEEDAYQCAQDMLAWLATKFSFVGELIESPIKGKTGNLEFLIWLKV